MSSIEATGSRPVQQTEVDGVPVFWVDTGARLHAELVFGVGLADEAFLGTGVTHLVEHLAMHQLGDYAYAANAGVGVSITSFEVSSSPPVVVEHLRRVCRALAEPDPALLEVERRVIGAEEHSNGAPPVFWWPYAVWYGARGPGQVGNRQLAPHLLGADEVLAWSRRWFHRGNAALVLNGPPPADLALPLPDGPPPRRVPHAPLPVPAPAWTSAPIEDAVVAAMHGTWSAELSAGLAVLNTRLTRRLRHESGLVYDLDSHRTHLPGGAALCALAAEAPERSLWSIVEHLLDTLDGLSGAGPTEAELAHHQEVVREGLDDPEEMRGAALDAAVERVAGIPSTAGDSARILTGLRSEDVATALRAVRGSLVVGLPDGHRLHRLPELPICLLPPVTGRVMARARFGSHEERGARLVLGETGISVFPGRDEEAVTVLFDDVVSVAIEPGPTKRPDDETMFVVGSDGHPLVLRARNWRDGAAAVAALRAAVPADRFYLVPEELRLTH